MKIYFLRGFVIITILAFSSFSALAECPDGKEPITMVTKSGITKILCINAKAVQGIENAADNSSTTIVPTTCPKGCWSPTNVEYWSEKGELTCSWGNRNELICKNVPVVGDKLVFSLNIETDHAVCRAIDLNYETKINKDEETEACLALLEPYVASSPPVPGLDCPCAGKYEGIVDLISPKDILGCVEDEYALKVTAGSRDMFSFFPGAGTTIGKQTCGINNTSLETISDYEAQSCIDFLDAFITYNGIVCQ